MDKYVARELHQQHWCNSQTCQCQARAGVFLSALKGQLWAITATCVSCLTEQIIVNQLSDVVDAETRW